MKLRRLSVKRLLALILVVTLVATASLGFAKARQIQQDISTLEKSLQGIKTPLQPSLTRADMETVRKMERDLEQLEVNLEKLKNDTAFLRTIAPIANWIPGVGGNLKYLGPIVDEGLSLTHAATLTLKAISPVLQLSTQGSVAEDLLIQAKKTLMASHETFNQALEELEQADAYDLQINHASLSSKTSRLLTLSKDYKEQLRSFILLGIEGPQLIDSIIEIEEQARLITPRLQTLKDAPQDVVKECGKGGPLIGQISSLEQSAGRVHSKLSTLSPLPPITPDLSAAPTLLEMALNLAQSGRHALEGVCEIASLFPSGLFTNDFGPRAERSLDLASSKLNQALEALEEAKEKRNTLNPSSLSPKSAAFVAVLDNNLDDVDKAISLSLAGVEVAKEFLGFNGPRKYLMLGQDRYELRGTGGFIAGIWQVTLDRGEISQILFHYSPDADNVADLSRYPPPPESMFTYMGAGYWLLRDASWLPDFPTTARVVEELYRIGQGTSVDGVIALNQQAIKYLVEGLGDIPLDGTDAVINAENVDEMLLTGLTPPGVTHSGYNEPRIYLMRSLGEALVSRIKGGMTPEEAIMLTKAVVKSLDEKHLLIYSHDPNVEKILTERNWVGSLASPFSDYLLVVDSNIYSGKANKVIEQIIDYSVDLTDPKSPKGSLTLTYRNRSPRFSDTCIQVVSHDVLASQRCYYDYLRIYLPKDTELVHVPSLPLPTGTFYDKLGMPLITDTIATRYDEGGKLVVEGFFVVPMNETRSLTFSYQLPSSVLKGDGNAIDYRLLIQKQPGTLGHPTKVSIAYPKAWRLRSSSPNSRQDPGGSSIVYNLVLSKDQEIQLYFETNP